MEEWNKNTFAEDGQFACPICKGKKVVKIGRLKNADCPGCLGTGHLVDYLAFDAEDERRRYKRESENHQKLILWAKETSTCKTCGGDSYKTMGGIPCKECGLEGSAPWGG